MEYINFVGFLFVGFFLFTSCNNDTTNNSFDNKENFVFDLDNCGTYITQELVDNCKQKIIDSNYSINKSNMFIIIC